jgi:hypothetical protein
MPLMGEFLRAGPKNKGAAGIGKSVVPKENRTPTRAEQGCPDKKFNAAAQALAKLERKHAKKRQATSTGGKNPKLKSASGNFPEAEVFKGQTGDKVSAAVGMSRPTYQKAAAVVHAADQDPATFGPVKDEM